MTSLEHGQRARVLRAMGSFQMAFQAAQRRLWLLLARLDRLAQFQRLALLWVVGSIALGLATFVCFGLDLNFATAAFVFLIVIVVFSLLDSFISCVVFSAIAVGCLNYFFVEPLYSFRVGDAQNLAALTAFIVTSLAVASLARRVRNLQADISLREAEAHLADARREPQLTIDSIPALVVTFDPDGTPSFVNRAWRDFTGLTLEQARGHQPFFHPDDTDRADHAWHIALAGGDPFSMECRLRSTDGTYRWHFIRRKPSRNDKGEITKWYGVAFDIEDQKQAENALRRSETRLAGAERELRITLDSIPAITWRGAANGYVQHLNKRWFEYTGTTPEQVRGAGWKSCIHPDDLERLVDIGREYVATGKPIDCEARLRRHDGKYRWFLFRPAPTREETGKIVGWYGTITDIEDRKRAETALRRSEAYLAEAQRLSRTGSFGWNVSTGEIFWAEETFRIFGYEATITPSIQRVLQRVHPDDVALVRQVTDHAASAKQGFDFEHRLLMPDGSVKDLRVVAHTIPDSSNLQFVGAVMDITAQKNAYAALERSEQRYRNLFHHMPVALWQLNARGVVEQFKKWRSEGVTDLGAHFDAHPDLVQRCMEMMIIEEVNEHTVQMLGGRDSREFVGTSIAPYFPRNSPTFRRSMISRYRGEPQFGNETKLSTLDGRVLDVLYTASRVGMEREPGMSLLGVIDITERKKAEEGLRRSEQRYQNLFQAMAVAFFEFDFSDARDVMQKLRASGVTDFRQHFRDNPEIIRELMRATRLIEVNDRTVELLGRGHRRGLLDSVETFWPNESTQAYAEILLSALEGKRSFSVETPIRRTDGSVFDAQVTLWYSAEEPNRGLGGVTDISERKQAFLALEKSERRYQNMFQAMAVAFFEFDFSGARDVLRGLRASGLIDLRQHFKENPETVRQFMRATRIIEVNDHTVALVGRGSREGLIGSVEPFWPEESTQAYAEVMLSALERKRSFSIETPFCRTDGSLFDGHFTVWYSADEPTRGLAGVIDISERVKAQTMLNRLQADFAHAARISILGELTASIAHEVNQPLGAIAASGEASLRWLDRPSPDVNEVRELTRQVVADARRASEIIGRIRAMATGSVPAQTLLPLDDIIRDALLFLRHELQARDITVSHFPATAAPKVLGDRTQLQQVVVNLVVNAIQAMTQDGSVGRRISIRTVVRDPATLHCSVEDSGPGIAPQHIARLFESFFTTKDGGMGMGLRICRSVIEAHSGRIAADNESSHGGARFFFTLPVHNTAA